MQSEICRYVLPLIKKIEGTFQIKYKRDEILFFRPKRDFFD